MSPAPEEPTASFGQVMIWDTSPLHHAIQADNPQEFPDHLRKYLWGDHFWSPSYFAASCGGAPLSVVKDYIEQQKRPT